MKIRKVFISIMCVLAVFLFSVGCGKTSITFDTKNAVKVTYKLEGGIYKDSEFDLIQYYTVKEGAEACIKDPGAENKSDRLSDAKVTKAGYELEGWYRTRTEKGGDVEYDGQWDFSKDKIKRGDEAITLYASWVLPIHYTYQIYYTDETGAEQKLGSPYRVEAGARFDDFKRYREEVPGYTFVKFLDKDGNAWDESFTHPGGEESLEIKVVAVFEKGEFVEVSTVDELKAARNKDIKLMADIDFGGERFAGFGDYKKIFKGNGHKIKNFVLDYPKGRDDLDDGTLNISLFGYADGAEITGVSFEGVDITVSTTLSRFTKKIVVAPIAISAKGAKISDVSVTGTYKLGDLPTGFDKTRDLTVVTTFDGAAYPVKDTASVLSGITVTIDNQISIA